MFFIQPLYIVFHNIKINKRKTRHAWRDTKLEKIKYPMY